MVVKFNGDFWNSKHCWSIYNDDGTRELVSSLFDEPRQEYIGERIHLIKRLSGRETRIKYNEKGNKICEFNIYSNCLEWCYYNIKGYLTKKVTLKDGTKSIYYYNDKELFKTEIIENREKTVYDSVYDCNGNY